MAATTLKAIIDRFQAVLEGADLNLKKATEEFSFDLQPNLRINNVYRIEDGGLGETATISNSTDVRMDLLNVWLARKATTDSQKERETLETTINTVERKIIADGPSNNYHATLDSREIERLDEGDVLIARVGILVDYDYSLT